MFFQKDLEFRRCIFIYNKSKEVRKWQNKELKIFNNMFHFKITRAQMHKIFKASIQQSTYMYT